jgi:two-component system osmolarity sensor histidine kinase EnvZ
MMPRSLLARTFLLLAMLVLLTTAAWLSLFRYIDAEPRARETAQLAASAVNLIRASLFAAAPEKRLAYSPSSRPVKAFASCRPSLRTRSRRCPTRAFIAYCSTNWPTASAHTPALPPALMKCPASGSASASTMTTRKNTGWCCRANGPPAALPSHWLAWGLLAIVLALAVAWLIASRISRPLKAMAKSAETVGRGQTPAPLPEGWRRGTESSCQGIQFTMATDLQRHEQDRSEVLAGISHDLRTPLTRLRLEAEMSIADSGAQQAVIADIEQMEAVISQFMDYARAESGEEAVIADLTYLLENIVERQACVGRPCRLELAELPELPLRPKAITRAITNLIDNAWKYGGGEVTVKTAAVNGEIWLEISDHGPGIPASEIERLKRPFTRLETARTNASGTGLGLAIVERIARLHNGRLDLLPNPGGGLLARLVLPING